MNASTPASRSVPLVGYFHLEGDEPHLVASRCRACGARFFDRRNACAGCGATEFEASSLATEGTVRSFTVVHRATPDVKVPYVSVLVELDDGKTVKANLIGIDDDADRIVGGMRVALTTWTVGHDPEGAAAITFGFRPLAGAETGAAR